MGALTEVEIFGVMQENLRLALEHCRALAVSPREGYHYSEYRKALKLVEGACRQASVWREDTRWLDNADNMAKAHQQAGEWLRGVQVEIEMPAKDGWPAYKMKTRQAIPKGKKHPLFMILADVLEFMMTQVEIQKTAATHKLGMILPEMPNLGRRVGAPVHFTTPKGMHKTSAGIIIPDGAGAQ